MAKTIVAAEIQVGGEQQVKQAVKNVKAELRDATNELIRLQEEFGKTSEPAVAAARRVAELRDQISDAREAADLFDPGKKMAAFTNATKAATGGISALTGAAALFGQQSEDLEKTLVKVQGAMAFSEGVSTILDAAKNFEELKIVAVDALKGIKTGLITTGIGALVVALGLIVGYWDEIIESVTGVSSAQKENLETTKQIAAAEKEKLDHIGAQENILKLSGKSEKEILQMKIDQTKQVVAAGEAQLKAQMEIQKAQIETAERNKQILQGILTFLTLPLQALTAGIDAVGSTFGKNFGLNAALNKGLGSVASLLFDPADVKKKADATNAETQKGIDESKNQAAGFQLQMKALNKAAYDARIEQEKLFNEEMRKIREAQAEAELKYEYEKQQLKLKQEHDAELQRIKELKLTASERNELMIAAEKLFETQRQAALDKARQDYQDAQAKKNKEFYDRIVAEDKDRRDKENVSKEQKQLDDVEGINRNLEIRRQLVDDDYQQRLDSIDDWEKKTVESISNNEELKNEVTIAAAKKRAAVEAEIEAQKLAVINGLLGQGIKLLGQHTAAGKALAIAQAVINIRSGITSALSSKAAPFIEPWATITRVASAALIGINGAKAIADIIKTPVPGFGGGGGAAAAMPTITPPAVVRPTIQSTMIDQDQVNQIGNAAAGGAVRAYVVDSDVENSRERITRLNRAARLGG